VQDLIVIESAAPSSAPPGGFVFGRLAMLLLRGRSCF